jgi:diacylglycerol kinase (ATP)
VRRRPILLLVNPVAGGKPGSGPGLHDDPDRLAPESMAGDLRARGLEVDLHELSAEDDAGSLARRAADAGSDVVVAGGDGTVSGVAAALLGHESATLGILAMGSFNNIARGFGVPATLDAALDAIESGTPALLDAGWVARDEGARPFFEAAGVGIDAVGFLAVEVAEKRGWWRAVRALWRGLRMRKSPMRITIDGTAYRTASPAMTVSNGPYHGMGFAVAEDADPTDGLLTITVFHGMGRWEVLRHFISVARRRRRREPRVGTYTGRAVTIEGTRRALPAHADGVSIGLTPVTLEVKPKALRIFRQAIGEVASAP